jgi:hypothetical protein
MEAGMLQSIYRGIVMDFAERDIQESPSLLLRILSERLKRQLTDQELQLIHTVFSETHKQHIQALIKEHDLPYPALQLLLKKMGFGRTVIYIGFGTE